MGDKCIENIPVTKYIYFPERMGGADREPTAPALEATVLWFRHAGVFRAGYSGCPGTGAEGVGGQLGSG